MAPVSSSLPAGATTVKTENTSNPLGDNTAPAASGAPPGHDKSRGLGYMDDEDDSGELNLSSYTRKAWLARMPHDFWEAVNSLPDNDSVVRVGVVRVWKDAPATAGSRGSGSGPQVKKMRLILDKDLPGFENIPKEHDLVSSNDKPSTNMFVFSEKDIPGYKPGMSNNKNASESGAQGQSSAAGAGSSSKSSGGKSSKWNKFAKFEPRFRQSIPKRTALTASILREFDCRAVKNAEFDKIRDERLKHLVAAETARTVIKTERPNDLQMAGMTDFIKLGSGAAASKSRSQESKSIRTMTEDQLTDAIVERFREYRYVSVRYLKNHTNQPEAYVRTVLERVAERITAGPYTNHWALRSGVAEHMNVNLARLRDAAEDGGEGSDLELEDDDVDEEDEDEMEMEDAL